MTPTTPSAVEHARLADGEVGDVDHLLHLAVALGLDLAHLQRNEAAEGVLVHPQRLAELAHDFAPARCRHLAPGRSGRRRRRQHRLVVGLVGGRDPRDHRAVGRVDRVEQAVVARRAPTVRAMAGTGIRGGEAEGVENIPWVGHVRFLIASGPVMARFLSIVSLPAAKRLCRGHHLGLRRQHQPGRRP
jgi:hypothetical protein